MGGYSKIKSIITTECKNKTHNPSSPTDLPLNLPDENQQQQQKQTTEPAEDKTKSEPTTEESTDDINESKKSATETNPSPSSDEEKDDEQIGGDQERDNYDDGRRNVNGEDMKLKRNSSTATYRFMRFDKQSSKNGGGTSSKLAIQGAVRRAFSLRRSSSVSERYSRIYDRSVTVTSPIGDEDQEVDNNETDEKSGKSKSRKKSSSNKIIRACKRILGL